MGASVPSKTEILMEYYHRQSESMSLLFESDRLKNEGKLDAAVDAYGRLAAALRRQLELAEINNLHYSDTPFGIGPIVGPLSNALSTLGDVLEALGKLDDAEEVREEAMRVSGRHLSDEDRAGRERQRANTLVAQGRFNEALVALAAARDIFEERGDALNMASVAANIAGVLEWLGDYERALIEVDRAARLIEPLTSGAQPSQSDILASLLGGQLEDAQTNANLMRISLEIDQTRARVNRYAGNFAEAERQFTDILPRVPQNVAAGIVFQMAAVLIGEGRFGEGLSCLEGIEQAFSGLFRPKWGVFLSLKGEALLGLDRPGDALACLDESVLDLSDYRDPDCLWKARWRRARALKALGRQDEALSAFAEAAETVNGLRRAPLGYRLDSTYLRDKLPLFGSAIALACESGEAESCCRLMEMIKSRILTSTLSIPAGGQPETATDLDRRVDELSRRIDALEYTGFNQGWTDKLEERRRRLLSERSDLTERIRIADPRWRSLSQPVPFDLDETLDLLRTRGQAVLTLFSRPDRVTAVLLKDGQCRAARAMLSAEAGAALAGYLDNLQRVRPDPKSFDPSAQFGLSADSLVSRDLLEPALHASSLVVVPHGNLHLLPWAGLLFEGKRLFEYCPVGLAPNVSCLLALDADFSGAPGIALIGDPDYARLPNLAPLGLAAEELRTISETYPSNRVIGNPLLGAEATEGSFWQLTRHEESPGSILHVACHGTFETGDPMNSSLLMTDAKVDATEIARSRLAFQEVVLSACSTGHRPTQVRGIELTGDDILGLPGAFLEAGVRSVLVSIPPARDDATLAFMTIYHEQRAKGDWPMRALQATQTTMIEDDGFPPHLWVGFTVYGCQ